MWPIQERSKKNGWLVSLHCILYSIVKIHREEVCKLLKSLHSCLHLYSSKSILLSLVHYSCLAMQHIWHMAPDNMRAMIKVNTKWKDTFQLAHSNICRRFAFTAQRTSAHCQTSLFPLQTVSNLSAKPGSLLISDVLLFDSVRHPPSKSAQTNTRLTHCKTPENESRIHGPVSFITRAVCFFSFSSLFSWQTRTLPAFLHYDSLTGCDLSA